uniref:Uncharacterized protein n=1 Tax=Acanthochromis polyacanthus TaxID=80966 RepID=A0A3Q1FBG1_9TELE
MSGCEVFNSSNLSDLLQVNREKTNYATDWTSTCSMPSARTEKAARFRQVVSDRPQPPAPGAPPSDCLVSCFCLESVSPDLASFTTVLSCIQGLLGPITIFVVPGVKIPEENNFPMIRLEVYMLRQGMRVGVDSVTVVFYVKAKKE